MGFGDGGQKRIYCGIKAGKIAHRINESTVELHHDLTGQLTDAYVKADGKFGPELHLIITDSTDAYQLQMQLNSGYARAFLCIAKNIAPASPATFIPTYKEKDGVKETGMIIRQDGSALKWFFKNDTPNGMPELVPCKIRNQAGQLVDGWDNTERMNFLLKVLNEEVRPLLIPGKVVQRNSAVENIHHSDGFTDNINDPGAPDDLPF